MALKEHAAAAARKQSDSEVVIDSRTADEREAELAMQAKVKALLRRDDGSEGEALRSLNRDLESQGSSRIKTPGGSMRRVKFDTAEAASKANEKKKKGGSKGLRPSFPVQRQDMLQYPQYTNYFKGDDGAEFQQEQEAVRNPSPAAGGAVAPPPTGVNNQSENLSSAFPPLNTGASRALTDEIKYEKNHPLEEAMPLPRTSNVQVLEPIHQGGWDVEKPAMGTRGLGTNPSRDIYGNQRGAPVNNIPTTLKMQPAMEANERYQAIEDPVRRGLKTMSAQNLQMGGVGLGGRDPSRGFLAHPQEIRFGRVEADKMYQLRLTLMNAGIDSSRFQVRKPKSVEVRYKTGMVAAGMSIVLQVIFSANVSVIGRDFEDEIQIVTENEIFRIPITASVLSSGDFGALEMNQRTSAPEFVAAPKPPGLSREAPAVEIPQGDPGEGEDQE